MKTSCRLELQQTVQRKQRKHVMTMNEEQQAKLNEANTKFNSIAQESGRELEKIYNETLVPLVHRVTQYKGELSVKVEAHGKIRVQGNQLIPDVTSIATLVFHDPMPSDQLDPM